MESFLNFWQNIPQHINPNLIQIGEFKINYYGLMYLVAFFIVYILVSYRIKNEKYNYSNEIISDYFTWAILGVIFGGRFGYVLFYNFSYYLHNPISIISPFDFSNGFHYTGISGMSYHGGVIGVVIASILFCYKKKINFWNFMDLIVPAIPLGYTFGRLGNFINGELYGRITKSFLGMYFPETHQLRYPSQLFEAFFEGLFLFIILWLLRKKKYFNGFLSSLYLIGYGIIRFFIEFIREPDVQLGFILGHFTMGQILCFIMIITGIFIFIYNKKHYKI